MSDVLTEAEVEEIRAKLLLANIYQCEYGARRKLLRGDIPRLLASHEELRRRGVVMREALEYLRVQLPPGLEYESRIAADALKEAEKDG